MIDFPPSNEQTLMRDFLASKSDLEFALQSTWWKEALRRQPKSVIYYTTSSSFQGAKEAPEAQWTTHKESPPTIILQRFKRRASWSLDAQAIISTKKKHNFCFITEQKRTRQGWNWAWRGGGRRRSMVPTEISEDPLLLLEICLFFFHLQCPI